jgi:hypothetical protein
MLRLFCTERGKVRRRRFSPEIEGGTLILADSSRELEANECCDAPKLGLARGNPGVIKVGSSRARWFSRVFRRSLIAANSSRRSEDSCCNLSSISLRISSKTLIICSYVEEETWLPALLFRRDPPRFTRSSGRPCWTPGWCSTGSRGPAWVPGCPRPMVVGWGQPLGPPGGA